MSRPLGGAWEREKGRKRRRRRRKRKRKRDMVVEVVGMRKMK